MCPIADHIRVDFFRLQGDESEMLGGPWNAIESTLDSYQHPVKTVRLLQLMDNTLERVKETATFPGRLDPMLHKGTVSQHVYITSIFICLWCTFPLIVLVPATVSAQVCTAANLAPAVSLRANCRGAAGGRRDGQDSQEGFVATACDKAVRR